MTQQLKPFPVAAARSVGGERRVKSKAGEPRLDVGCWGTEVGAAVVVGLRVEGDIVGCGWVGGEWFCSWMS